MQKIGRMKTDSIHPAVQRQVVVGRRGPPAPWNSPVWSPNSLKPLISPDWFCRETLRKENVVLEAGATVVCVPLADALEAGEATTSCVHPGESRSTLEEAVETG